MLLTAPWMSKSLVLCFEDRSPLPVGRAYSTSRLPRVPSQTSSDSGYTTPHKEDHKSTPFDSKVSRADTSYESRIRAARNQSCLKSVYPQTSQELPSQVSLQERSSNLLFQEWCLSWRQRSQSRRARLRGTSRRYLGGRYSRALCRGGRLCPS